MYNLIRKHVVPSFVSKKFILLKYMHYLQQRDATPTTFELKKFIHRRFRREDVWYEVTVVIEYEDEKGLLDAVMAESMDDISPYVVHSRDTTISSDVASTYIPRSSRIHPLVCSICLDSNGEKIKLNACGCVFHSDCISKALKYKSVCPLCYSSINKKKHISNAEKKTKTGRRRQTEINDHVY